jgi:hypothetical protein
MILCNIACHNHCNSFQFCICLCYRSLFHYEAERICSFKTAKTETWRSFIKRR